MRLVLCVNPQAPQESPTKDVPAGGGELLGTVGGGGRKISGKFCRSPFRISASVPFG